MSNWNNKIPIHPLTGIFPEVNDEEYAKLRADILRNGQKVPIVLFDNMILSGRARYRICVQHTIVPLLRNWDGDGTLLEFLVGENLLRRRLTDPQRGMAAARAMPESGYGTLKAGKYPEVPTRARLAELFNLAPSTIYDYRVVLKRGTPEEIKLVESGIASCHVISRQIGRNVPPDSRAKESGRMQALGVKNTMSKMGQVAYAMVAEAEQKRSRKRKLPVAVAPKLEVVKPEDALLAHVKALLQATAIPPNHAAILLAKEIPEYSLGALIDWLAEVQERIYRIHRKQEREGRAA